MISVGSHIFKVVVLAAGTDTLLAVGRPAEFGAGQPEEDVFELIHSRIGEKQRIITNRHYRRAWDKLVSLAFEKIYKVASYLFSDGHYSLSLAEYTLHHTFSDKDFIFQLLNQFFVFSQIFLRVFSALSETDISVVQPGADFFDHFAFDT